MSTTRAGALVAPTASLTPQTSEPNYTTPSHSVAPSAVTRVSEETLNPFFENFDTVHALHAGSHAVASALPHPRDCSTFTSAPTLNNLWACASLRTAPFRLLQQPAPVTKNEIQKLPQQAEEAPSCKKRRVSNVSSPHRLKGVLQAMMDKAAVGPLSTLAVAVAHRRRIRITLRSRHSLRGRLTARLVAFDKHINLLLRDAIFDDSDDTQHRSLFALTLIRGEHVVVVALI